MWNREEPVMSASTLVYTEAVAMEWLTAVDWTRKPVLGGISSVYHLYPPPVRRVYALLKMYNTA